MYQRCNTRMILFYFRSVVSSLLHANATMFFFWKKRFLVLEVQFKQECFLALFTKMQCMAGIWQTAEEGGKPVLFQTLLGFNQGLHSVALFSAFNRTDNPFYSFKLCASETDHDNNYI